jgi:hypothetical protein
MFKLYVRDVDYNKDDVFNIINGFKLHTVLAGSGPLANFYSIGAMVENCLWPAFSSICLGLFIALSLNVREQYYNCGAYDWLMKRLFDLPDYHSKASIDKQNITYESYSGKEVCYFFNRYNAVNSSSDDAKRILKNFLNKEFCGVSIGNCHGHYAVLVRQHPHVINILNNMIISTSALVTLSTATTAALLHFVNIDQHAAQMMFDSAFLSISITVLCGIISNNLSPQFVERTM